MQKENISEGHLDLYSEDSIWPNSRKILVIRRHSPGNLPDLKMKLKILYIFHIHQNGQNETKQKQKTRQCSKGYKVTGTLKHWESVHCMTTLEVVLRVSSKAE